MTPAGLSFFQCEYDETVQNVFWNTLGTRLSILELTACLYISRQSFLKVRTKSTKTCEHETISDLYTLHILIF